MGLRFFYRLYRAFDTSNIIDIHTYWMKKHNIKYLGLLKKCLSNY